MLLHVDRLWAFQDLDDESGETEDSKAAEAECNVVMIIKGLEKTAASC